MTKKEFFKKVTIYFIAPVLLLSFAYLKLEKLNEVNKEISYFVQGRIDVPITVSIVQLNDLLKLEKELRDNSQKTETQKALLNSKEEILLLITDNREQAEKLLRRGFLLNLNHSQRLANRSIIDSLKELLKVSSIKESPIEVDFDKYIKENNLIKEEELREIQDFFKEDSKFMLNKLKLDKLLRDSIKNLNSEEHGDFFNKYNGLFNYDSINLFKKL